MQVDSDILCAIEAFGLKPDISIIPIKPENSFKAGFCHDNVKAQINSHGGQQIFGWHFWPKGHWIQAEFHSIWRSPAGMLIDVTPSETEETSIIFVTDFTRQFTGAQIENLYFNYKGCLLVDDYISLSRLSFKFSNSGYRSDVHPAEFNVLDTLHFNALIIHLLKLDEMIESGATHAFICCDNNLSYSKCHHVHLQNFVADFQNQHGLK